MGSGLLGLLVELLLALGFVSAVAVESDSFDLQYVDPSYLFVLQNEL